MLRDLVLTRMGRYNDEATVAEARKRFAQHVSGTKALPADLRGPVSVLVFLVHTVVHQKKKKNYHPVQKQQPTHKFIWPMTLYYRIFLKSGMGEP